MILFERLLLAQQRLAPVQPRYRLLWCDTDRGGDGLCIFTPDPHWLAAALAGGVLPPVASYFDGDAHVDAEPIGPLSEEQAMEYLAERFVPPECCPQRGDNARHCAIVPAALVPQDRQWRDAWRLAQYGDERAAA